LFQNTETRTLQESEGGVERVSQKRREERIGGDI